MKIRYFQNAQCTNKSVLFCISYPSIQNNPTLLEHCSITTRLHCFVHSALFMKELVFKIRAPWTYLTHTCSCQIIVSYLDSISHNTNKRPDPTHTRVLVEVQCWVVRGLISSQHSQPPPSLTNHSLHHYNLKGGRREALYAWRQYWCPLTSAWHTNNGNVS